MTILTLKRFKNEKKIILIFFNQFYFLILIFVLRTNNLSYLINYLKNYLQNIS